MRSSDGPITGAAATGVERTTDCVPFEQAVTRTPSAMTAAAYLIELPGGYSLRTCLELCDDRVGNLARTDGGRIVPLLLQVVGDVLAGGDPVRDGRVEGVGGGDFPSGARLRPPGSDNRHSVDL